MSNIRGYGTNFTIEIFDTPECCPIFTGGNPTWSFLDAFSHLYKGMSPSVGLSIRPLVRLSVRRSVRHLRVDIMFKCHLDQNLDK